MANLLDYTHKSYDGGLNDSASDQEIKANEASLLRNWDITYKGQLKRRDGLVQKGNTIHASNPITGLHGYYRSGGGKDLLAIVGTTLYYLNGSTWTALDSGFSAGDFWMEDVMPVDEVFIGNEDNQLHSWDRAATTLNSCLTDLGAAVPHGNVMRWHKNHMFQLNNVNVSGTKYPHRVYISEMGTPDIYDTGNDYFDVPGAGRLITAMDLGENLVLFKERAIQFLSGWGVASWAITASSSNVANIDEQVGIAGIRAVTRVGNEAWFMDDEGQIRRLYQTDFDAYRRDIVSTKIQGTLAGLNKSQLAKVRAWSWNDKVYFAVPTGSSTVNDLVLVFDLIASRRTGEEAWTTYTGWAPSIFCDFNTSTTPELYLGGNAAGKIWVHSGEDDDGVAIDARWDEGDNDLGKKGRRKRLKFGDISATSGAGDVEVDIYASVDGGPFADLGSLSLMAEGSRLGPTGSATTGPTGVFQLGGGGQADFRFYYTSGGGNPVGKTLKHSIRHAVVGEQPTVDTFESYYKLKPLR